MNTLCFSLLTWESDDSFLTHGFLLPEYLLSQAPSSSSASVTPANYFEGLDPIHTFGSLSFAGGVFRCHVADFTIGILRLRGEHVMIPLDVGTDGAFLAFGFC